MTSHAAVVARGMGKPCVSGCELLEVDLENEVIRLGEKLINKGDILSIDGSTGRVVLGEIPLVRASLSKDFETFLDWCDDMATMEVWANSDTPEDALRARKFGARGIGLCRTEHMFMAPDRLPVMQEMIIADNPEERDKRLSRLKDMQKEDFKTIFTAMDGLPVIIRLLDPPLHEFLPKEEELLGYLRDIEESGYRNTEEYEKVHKAIEIVRNLREANPMMGFRGCRLGIIHPEIYEMQVRSIFEALSDVKAKGIDVVPEIMIPLVGVEEELSVLKDMVTRIAGEFEHSSSGTSSYRVGTMIELPRAVCIADKLAKHAEFFSFGTNDLTQTTLGISRDDAEAKFLLRYVDQGIMNDNPFHSIDREGVGSLMAMAVQKGRSVRPEMSIGICGEHGGDPNSIAFCHSLGLNYVSCSPYRVPVARIAAAHAEIGLIN
jgi:pyruvate,orthophosphate dikinase